MKRLAFLMAALVAGLSAEAEFYHLNLIDYRGLVSSTPLQASHGTNSAIGLD